MTLREARITYRGPDYPTERFLGPAEVARFVRSVVGGDAREHLVAIYLDTRHRPIGFQVVSVGTANASLGHPREVFQPAVHLGAVSVILAHNHPSGDPSPSQEDRDLTERMRLAGELLGIHVLDHVVVGARGHVSLAGSK